MKRLLFGVIVCLTFISLFFSWKTSSAVEFLVTTVEDQVDDDLNDPECAATITPGITRCSLRAAIQQANFESGKDIILIPEGSYLILGEGEEDNSLDGDLDITDEVNIIGEGANKTLVRGSGGDRLIHIIGDIEVKITGLAVEDGIVIGENGGGILIEQSDVTIEECAIRENLILNPGALGGDGGGIYLQNGSLVVTKSLISNNEAHNHIGGGLFNNGGEVLIQNSTITGNVAEQDGGAIRNFGGGDTSIIDSTISFNRVLSGSRGGIDNSSSATMTLQNSILANNEGLDSNVDCIGPLILLGHNIIGTGAGKTDNNCNIQGLSSTDQIGSVSNPIDPLLGPLQDNGGPTETHALLNGSPAIDMGDPDNCPNMDQRGIERPQGSGCDIGAFEVVLACGDGILQDPEECDDGNTEDGDGCDSQCLDENTGDNNDGSNTGGCALSKVSQGGHSSFLIFWLYLSMLMAKVISRSRAVIY